MRGILLCMLLGGCAAPTNTGGNSPPAPDVAAMRHDCPPLPTLKRGAGRQAMLTHIDTTARMYADCATRER